MDMYILMLLKFLNLILIMFLHDATTFDGLNDSIKLARNLNN